MSVSSPPVTTDPNETRSGHTQQAHPQIERPPDVPPAPAGRAKLLIGIALLILLIGGTITFLNRRSEANALAKETEAVAIPTVAVVQPKAEPGNEELVLPGNLLAFEESPIFARTNGYLLRWYKDIGSHVSKRRTAGGDRHSRSRSGTVAGPRRPGADQRGAGSGEDLR